MITPNSPTNFEKKLEKGTLDDQLRYLLIIGLILATIYVFFVSISFIQIAGEREKCKHTPIDEMSQADFQYCLRLR